MAETFPLVFEPIYRPKVWGGRRLESLLGRRLPPGEAVGESWECADLESGESIVAKGPAAGKRLNEIVREWGGDLLGNAKLIDSRFPLLIKFLDAVENLSLQVHPHEDATHPSGFQIRAKHEAWHILDAGPDAVIFRGLRPGVSIDDLRSAVRRQPSTLLDYLERIPVRNGQTYYLPSGTPHALGAGVVVAEIQTPSDVTYRLYDWDRTRPESDSGLHVEQGLDCIRPNADFARHEKRSHVTSLFSTVSRLIECPQFIIEKVRFVAELEQELPYVEPAVWIVLQGRGEILHGANQRFPFGRGDVILLPAALKKPRLRTLDDCHWLEVTLPIEPDWKSESALARKQRRENSPANPIIPLNISIPPKL